MNTPEQNSPAMATGSTPLRAVGRALLLILGIIAGQVILYGPSLVGNKILLPLDLLARPGVYIPREAHKLYPAPHDRVRSDLVYYYEPERRFAQAELAAGRLPFWNPYRFAGAPSYRWSFSPPVLLAYFVASPVVLAWVEVLIALVAGIGAYVFFRRVLGVSFWPATIVAWCYPLSGAMIFWQGYGLPAVMCWLPWVLLATNVVVRRPMSLGGPSLALLTAIVLVGGAADIAGQLLLACGIYAVWCYFNQYGLRRPVGWSAIGMTMLAWGLGALMSLWLLAPMIEYVGTGARAEARSKGVEERPPVGLESLPQIVLPDFYGSTRYGHLRLVDGDQSESSAGAYAGLLATLVLGPLAWSSRRHRSINFLWLALIFISLSWSLNIPGMVHLLRLPGMNLMSHNRFVFVAAFALLCLAAIGLELLWNARIVRSWGLLAPIALLAALGAWSVYRALVLPEPLATQFAEDLRAGKNLPDVQNMSVIEAAQRNFASDALFGAVVCAVGVLFLLSLIVRRRPPWRVSTSVLAAAMLFEMFHFALGRIAQCEPSLYYAPIDVLAQIAKSDSGRVIGFGCLPANIAEMAGLHDIRGYDGVDPSAMTELLKQTALPGSTFLPYALTQWLSPLIQSTPQREVLLFPILDMLNVRYVIFRGSPPQGLQADMSGPDYWVLINHRAMPRVYVPEHVKVVSDSSDRLRLLASTDFSPRDVAYVDQDLKLPAACFGKAKITGETPSRIAVEADLESQAMVVLADHWDAGWKARVDGVERPIVRANHAIRGVVADAGLHRIEFRYQPASLQAGVCCSAIGLAGYLGWFGVCWWSGRRRSGTPAVPVGAKHNSARVKKRKK
jgi:hypothetical protein